MSDHPHAGGRPPGEAPRWLDEPANLKKLTFGFFGLCAVALLADVIFFFVHKHNSFQPLDFVASEGSEHYHPSGVEVLETTFGFYSVYGFVAIVLLVVLSVGLRKLVMQPEDFYSRDYDEPEVDPSDHDDGGTHHA